MTRESRAAVIVGEALTMVVRTVPVTCSCNGTCNIMGGVSLTFMVGLGAIAKEKSWCEVQGHAGQADTSVPFFLGVRYCGTQGERWKVWEWRQVKGAAGRRAKRSARCAQEERSGHLSNEIVSAEEEQKRAQQSA
eukprot:scaffold50183_cov70-Phaeocystis_antarctica.AAC.2